MKTTAINNNLHFKAYPTFNKVTTKSLYDEIRFSVNPNISRKRSTLSKYMANILRPENTSANLDFELLHTSPIADLLSPLNDNLFSIEKLFGKYGLAFYGEVKPEIIMKNSNSNIKEFGYSKNKTPKDTICNYLLLNPTGAVKDIFTRFGESGLYIYEKLKGLGIFSAGDGSYHISEQNKHRLSIISAERYEHPYAHEILIKSYE